MKKKRKRKGRETHNNNDGSTHYLVGCDGSLRKTQVFRYLIPVGDRALGPSRNDLNSILPSLCDRQSRCGALTRVTGKR